MCVNSFMKKRQIWGKNVVLVPYKELHVFKYNKWMQNKDLQYLTGSEPLSLEEEYDMLYKWINDSNKCTFITVDKHLFETTNSETDSMIGDVNLFFDSHNDSKTAEIEVMIAEESHRGLGKGKEATLLMMRFAIELIGVQLFVAKIKINNINSQNMFIKIGFKECSRSHIFQEITFNLEVNSVWIDFVQNITTDFKYHLL